MTNTKTQNIYPVKFVSRLFNRVKKQNLMFIAKRFLLCVSRYALCAFCAVVILAGFGFANKALAGYAISTTFVSSVITLDSAYPGDLLVIQADAPTGTTLSARVRAGSTATPDAASWDVKGDTWATGTPAISATVGSSTQLLVVDVGASISDAYQYFQYQLNGTTNETATWVVRDVFLIPQPTGYGRLRRIDNSSTNIQNTVDNRYYQWIALGASDKTASWNVDKIDLTSKFTAIDLGKRYNIDTLSLTDDDSLYRIHYSLEDVSSYTSAIQWADIEGLTASTTLSKTFTGLGQALRWFRFNRVADIGVSPSNPQALAKLAAQTSGSELYKLWKGDGAGTFETRTPGSDGKNTGGYVITLPNAAIGGQPSASEEYRICNGNIGQIKNFTIKLLVKDSSDGYKSGELSWNSTNWYSWDPDSTASTTTGAIINWRPIGEGGHSEGYGSTIPKTILDKNTSGCANYIPFWVRTKVPSSGVFEGSKSVRFYFEALVL